MTIVPRAIPFDFRAVPKHWLGGNAVATHVANGINLLFPAGERFFVRSVHRYVERLDDPELVARVRGFSGQEGHHAGAHQRFFAILEAQGYPVSRYLRFYDFVAYRVIEPLAPAALRLSTTVALEHFTALLAERALGGVLAGAAHPELEKLFLWHAAEEIEHKAVAFDVLARVHPSHALRVLGLVCAALLLGGLGGLAIIFLLWHDRLLFRWRTVPIALAAARRHPLVNGQFLRGVADYLRPGFHPSQRPSDGVATAYLEELATSARPSAAC